jgi:DNA-binding NarL/FixJ family response regulator
MQMTAVQEQTEVARFRVGLVSTDPLRLVGFQAIFEGHSRVDLVCAPLPEILRDTTLHLVLICMAPSEALFDLIDTFKGFRPDIRLIIMSRAPEPEQISRMIGSGAKGILPDSSSEKEIAMAIETVADGSIWAPRRVLAGLIDNSLPGAMQSPPNVTLT